MLLSQTTDITFHMWKATFLINIRETTNEKMRHKPPSDSLTRKPQSWLQDLKPVLHDLIVSDLTLQHQVWKVIVS